MNPVDGVALSDLPASLQVIAETVGFEATLKLIEHCGGTWVFVPLPEHCRTEHLLARMLGFDKLHLLAGLFGGERLDVPRAAGAMRALRDRRIRELEGYKTQRHIALEFGLTERQVRNILAGRQLIADERQQDFFG